MPFVGREVKGRLGLYIYVCMPILCSDEAQRGTSQATSVYNSFLRKHRTHNRMLLRNDIKTLNWTETGTYHLQGHEEAMGLQQYAVCYVTRGLCLHKKK